MSGPCPPANAERRTLKPVSAFFVDPLYDLKRSFSFLQSRIRSPAKTDVFQELVELQRPRVFGTRIFIDDRLRRPHFREHFVIIKPFQSVAAAQAFDMQFSALKIQFEGEQVLPFGATHLQPGGLSSGSAQTEKRIVIYRHVPKVGSRVSVNRRKFAHKRGREIDKMHALVNQLAASTQFGVRSPFPVIANTPAVAISGTNEH